MLSISDVEVEENIIAVEWRWRIVVREGRNTLGATQTWSARKSTAVSVLCAVKYRAMVVLIGSLGKRIDPLITTKSLSLLCPIIQRKIEKIRSCPDFRRRRWLTWIFHSYMYYSTVPVMLTTESFKQFIEYCCSINTYSAAFKTSTPLILCVIKDECIGKACSLQSVSDV